MIDTRLPATVGDDPPSARERFASWSLRGPLAVAVGLLCLWELAAWGPNYLTWPLWADHDVFATAARAWDAGMPPYRDLKGNNFPGTTYLFWILGKLFGFGWALGPAFYGFDALLVVAFGVMLSIWSARTMGRVLPGLVGYGGFLGYYLALDYSQAAQRDWQGPAFAMIGLLILQTWRGRIGRVGAALLSAFGLIIRPQAILLLPAQAVAIASEARARGRSAALAVAEWAAILAVGLVLAFLPLIAAHLWGDFREALRVVSVGGKYNLLTPAMFAQQFVVQLQPLRVDIVPLALVLLAGGASPATRRLALPWAVAFAGVLLYRPLSPHPHAYLTHPLMIVWSGLVALLVQVVLELGRLPATVRFSAVLLIAGLGLTAKPRFCNPNGSLEAIALLRAGREPGAKPTGYARHPDVPAASYYEWEDYRDLLDYLRSEVPETATIANCLKQVPAVTGPTGRVPAFPAESVAWLMVVNEDDEALFAGKLRDDPNAWVVWAPEEVDMPRAPKLPLLTEVIREDFEPVVRFGAIEVRRRKTSGLRK